MCLLHALPTTHPPAMQGIQAYMMLVSLPHTGQSATTSTSKSAHAGGHWAPRHRDKDLHSSTCSSFAHTVTGRISSSVRGSSVYTGACHGMLKRKPRLCMLWASGCWLHPNLCHTHICMQRRGYGMRGAVSSHAISKQPTNGTIWGGLYDKCLHRSPLNDSQDVL